MNLISFISQLSWLLWLLTLSVAAQPQMLTVKERVQVGTEKAQDFTMPLVTDADGNIYARYGDGEHPVEPITMISPQGRKLYTFDLDDVLGTGRARIVDFCTDGRGDLYVLVGTQQGDFSIVSFGTDRQVRTTMGLSPGVEPLQMAVLKNGDLMVAGRSPRHGESLDSAPMLAVVNPQGKIARNVGLQGDVAPEDKGERILNNGAMKRDKRFEASLAFSRMVTADNGSVYLMRSGGNAVVFGISPSGTTLQRLSLDAPLGYLLRQIRVAKGVIAALFITKLAEPNSEITAKYVRTYAADTGKLIAEYTLPSEVPSLLAGFDGQTGFTFFGADPQQNLTIFHVGL